MFETFFVQECIRKKNSNNPIQAYEAAKESFNRRGNEIADDRRKAQKLTMDVNRARASLLNQGQCSQNDEEPNL